ncbi:MAG: hypothetical protein KJ645_12980 [Planctomycetes bacterium]|nr:hypothetical protein [Planctomycetota bacterium]
MADGFQQTRFETSLHERRPASRVAALIWIVFLICGSSCALMRDEPVQLNIEARHYGGPDRIIPKRVLVLPFFNETEYKEQGSTVGEAFGQALCDRGCFEVIPLPEDDAEMMSLLKPYTTGRFPMEVLMELGSWYRADAVLMGCLKRYDPYSRPKIGLQADLISVYNGSVLCSVSGLLDSGEDRVARDLVSYYNNHHQHSHDESLSEWRGILSSPRMYARYACYRFVEALYPQPISDG